MAVHQCVVDHVTFYTGIFAFILYFNYITYFCYSKTFNECQKRVQKMSDYTRILIVPVCLFYGKFLCVHVSDEFCLLMYVPRLSCIW